MPVADAVRLGRLNAFLVLSYCFGSKKLTGKLSALGFLILLP